MAKKKKKYVNGNSLFVAPIVVPPAIPIPEGLVGYTNSPPVPPSSVDAYSDYIKGLNIGLDPTNYNLNDVSVPPYSEGVTIGDTTNNPIVPDTTNNFTLVIPQTIKISATGDQYIDAEGIIDDVPGVERWEIRVTKI